MIDFRHLMHLQDSGRAGNHSRVHKLMNDVDVNKQDCVRFYKIIPSCFSYCKDCKGERRILSYSKNWWKME